MADASVVDTNVLIVASAADDGSPFQPDATPVQEERLRQEVLEWMQAFDNDHNRSVVLDWDWHICGEYLKKLNPEQDYGWLAIMAKKDRDEVVWVGFDVDRNEHAKLPSKLRSAVSDKEDRKMVAAVLAAMGDGHNYILVNACDTDWLDCQMALTNAGIEVHHLLENWLTQRHAEKKQRGR